MRKIIFILFIAFTTNMAFGQSFKALANYEFKTVESYKTEEDKVLMAANHLFDNPVKKEDPNRRYAIQYIMKWMTGTPDYTFDLDSKSMELTKGNDELLMLYMAAMTKVVLDNKGEALTSNAIYQQAESILVNYCGDSKNKMKPSRKIKKILKSRKG